MKRIFGTGLALLLFGCNEERGNERVAKLAEAEIEQIRKSHPGLKQACLDRIRSGEVAVLVAQEAGCFDMVARRWGGLWNSGWEWTNFCPEPAKECPISSEHGDIWLEFAEGAYPKPEPPDGLYQIEFVGRRTAVPGAFGHLGQHDHLMVVDRLISMKKVPQKKEK